MAQPKIRWQWKCASGREGTLQLAEGNDILTVVYRADKRHDASSLPVCQAGAHCLTQLTNVTTGEVWLSHREPGLTTWKKASADDLKRSHKHRGGFDIRLDPRSRRS